MFNHIHPIIFWFGLVAYACVGVGLAVAQTYLILWLWGVGQ